MTVQKLEELDRWHSFSVHENKYSRNQEKTNNEFNEDKQGYMLNNEYEILKDW